MRLTIIQLKEWLSEIAEKHRQLHSFYYGDFLQSEEAFNIDRCSMLANVNNATISKEHTTLALELMIADVLNTSKSNETDIESDTLQIINDIYSVMTYSNKWQNVLRISQTTSPRKFKEETGSVVNGWYVTINLEVKKDKGFCDTPFDGYNFE